MSYADRKWKQEFLPAFDRFFIREPMREPTFLLFLSVTLYFGLTVQTEEMSLHPLTLWRLTTLTLVVPHRQPPDAAFYILVFIQQIYVLYILNMLHNLRFFFSSKCRLFHNATFFGSCIIHILNTGCAKI